MLRSLPENSRLLRLVTRVRVALIDMQNRSVSPQHMLQLLYGYVLYGHAITYCQCSCFPPA